MPEKKLIEVTVEKRLRVCKEIEATEEEIEFLWHNPTSSLLYSTIFYFAYRKQK